ncbi:MAG: hypothetical protein WA902_03515 [Thermosynechococcaceae cyanobacterium]
MANPGNPEEGASPVNPTQKALEESKKSDSVKQSGRVSQVQKTFVQISQWRSWPWVVVLVISWLSGVSAFRWLSSLPPSPSCGKLLAPTLSKADQLDCADRSARKGDVKSLSSALKLVGDWDKKDTLYIRASDLADEWSKAMLVLARQTMDKGDLKQAVAMANLVPESADSYTEAQALISKWQDNRGKGQMLVEEARADIKKQDWTQASLKVRSLVELGDDYWQGRADQLLKEMAIEKEAFKIVYEAESIAQSVGQYSRRRPEKLAEAIQLISKIDSKRLARDAGQEKVEEWSQDLLDIAQYQAEQGNFEWAVDAAQKIPPSSPVAKEATVLIQLGKAEVVAKDDDILSYLQAWALAQEVDDKDIEKAKSQEKVEEWEQEIRNFGQLELAKLFGNVDSIFTYQAAINQAALVKVDQPQRVEAQTLIAQWQKQIETYNDRQYIATSRRFAGEKTVLGYQAAIASARKVEIGQPLRIEAQTLVAEWENSIEKIEDQPILDEAKAKAKAGDLDEAIRIARKIESDRALYADARSDIADWVAQIQTAEDQPILNEADALANRGSLSLAISKASQIRYGRALYYDARNRISRWAGQRDAILAQRRQQQEAQQARQERRQERQKQRQERSQEQPSAPAVAPAPQVAPEISESE